MRPELGTREIHEVLRSRGIRVDETTLRRWLDSGYLVGIRVGARWYTSNAVLAEFLKNMGVSDEPQAGDLDHQEVAD